jgi:conjugal transfer pilus assembly protein TraW
MIFPSILAIAATDLQGKGVQAEDPRVETSQCGDSKVKASQGKGSQAEDPRVEDLGVYGETFPIEEKSLLEIIKTKLQALSASGKLEEHQKIILRKAKEQLNRPPPIKNIHRTTTPRSFDWDPSITVPYDLKDHKGQVFHQKGTKVNPLDTHSFRCPFLFVDGDDPEQVAWAIKQHQAARALHKPKIILVQGTPFALSKKLNLPVYFDQSGVLVKKFGITQVPARVSQKEQTRLSRALMVDEINLTGEKKHEN